MMKYLKAWLLNQLLGGIDDLIDAIDFLEVRLRRVAANLANEEAEIADQIRALELAQIDAAQQRQRVSKLADKIAL